MMNSPVLRARTQPQALVPASEHAAELDVELRRAQAIAKARDGIPTQYRDNPGLCLAIAELAHWLDMPVLIAMQYVSFIGGKPVIDASALRALAERNGYELDVAVGDTWAECTVTKPGGQPKSARYTMDDARDAGLLGKDNWKKNREDMLVARATSRCIRRHAPGVMLGMYLADEVESDPVAVLRSVPEPMAETADGITQSWQSPLSEGENTVSVKVTAEVIEDAVLVEDEQEVATIDTGWTVESLKVALKGAGLTQAQALIASSKPTLVELCKDSDAVAKLLAPAPTLAYSPGEEPF